jgi:hypothetical protein
MISSILADVSFIGLPRNNAENILPSPGVPSPPAHEKPEVHNWEHANFVLTDIAPADAFAAMRMQLLR